ncbi:hypothetical protein [Streptomyces tremellae]|uniref:Colicin D immunity protein domain-containing protein n=1 Tax=Streptomyces tremellae TaxID=1124239 RepID=A0ABP7F8Q6_9ACTN
MTDILGEDGWFASWWLRGKEVTPVPAGAELDSALRQRIEAGCRAVEADRIFFADLSGSAASDVRLPLGGCHAVARPPALWMTPGREGAVLFRAAGSAVVAGDGRFLAGAVPEGVDAARASFGRHARALADRHPGLRELAASYPPARPAWQRAEDVDPASSTGQQLALLEHLRNGALGAPEFAKAWWQARREAQRGGERVRGSLAELFGRVFMLLEDYPIDPALAEPGDLSDAGLRAGIEEAWEEFRRGSGT